MARKSHVVLNPRPISVEDVVTKTRRSALEFGELMNAYVAVHKSGGTIQDLATKLDRPLLSVVQRVGVMQKLNIEQYGKKLPKLARRAGGGRPHKNVQLPNFDDLMGNLAALD